MHIKEEPWDIVADLPQELCDLLNTDIFPLTNICTFDFDEEVCSNLRLLDSLIDGCPDAKDFRNHDCMWAGLCVHEKHERDSIKSEKVIVPTPQKKRPVVAPTNARSLLLPARRSPNRPDTPQSENDFDCSFPQYAEMLEDILVPVGPSEVTGQIFKPSPPPVRTFTAFPNTDHCYYTTVVPEPTEEDSVKTDCLGVQTPSDSEEEEEIDVETVTADPKKPSCRSSSSSSSGSLPTTPSLHDRHKLQLTMETAMNYSRGRRGTAPRVVVDRTMDISNTRSCRVASRKRSYVDECASDYSPKTVKRRRKGKGGRARKQRRIPKYSSSDSSDQDFTERRSMHNNMERQRRIELRNAFEELRSLVPETMDNEKAAKVVILNSGAQYCHDLTTLEKANVEKRRKERERQQVLKVRLSQLRWDKYLATHNGEVPD